jgi:hypothetical protein
MYPAPQPAPVDAPLPVLVSFPARAKQRRWTVLIRFILAIPLAVVVFILGIGAFFVLIIAWFGALFTGRMPRFARDYISRYLGFTANLSTYVYLLTDVFPPFSADDPGYPVHLAIPAETKLNRWAVFFRVILAIPVFIVQTVVTYGLGIFAFFLWLITLISGWLPLSAHNAISAVIRYQLRVTAYYCLVIPTYPNGLFGDGEAAPTTASNALLAEPTPGHATTLLDAPEGVTPTTDTYGTTPQTPASPPSAPLWTLLINRGARILLIAFIVVGALGYVGQISLQIATASHNRNDANTLNSSVSTLLGNFKTYEQTVQNCPEGTTRVACVEAAAATLSTQLHTFADNVDGLSAINVSPDSVDAAVASARTNAGIFDQLANAGPTVTDYNKVAQSVDLESHLDQLESDLDQI